MVGYYQDFAEAASKFNALDLEKATQLARDLILAEQKQTEKKQHKNVEEVNPLMVNMAKEDLRSLIRGMHDLAASILDVELYLNETMPI